MPSSWSIKSGDLCRLKLSPGICRLKVIQDDRYSTAFLAKYGTSCWGDHNGKKVEVIAVANSVWSNTKDVLFHFVDDDINLSAIMLDYYMEPITSTAICSCNLWEGCTCGVFEAEQKQVV